MAWGPHVSQGVIGSPGVGCFGVDGDGHEIAPPFSHTTSFQDVQAVCVGWTSSESVRKTVSVFVNNDPCVESTIAVGCGSGPHEPRN